MSTFPPPGSGPSRLPASPDSSSRRGLRGWPLWAKIAAPIGGLFVIGGVANAVGSDSTNNDSSAAVTLAAETSAPLATDAPIVVTTPTTAAATVTTAAPESTPAPTPPPPVAPTAPPTVAPTAAPTVPPTQAPPPPPSIQPAANLPLNDPQFGTCKEAKANGYGPYVQGRDPEYGWYQDRDNDGIVCE